MSKIIVIGAGPAGISAAIYARRGGAEVTVLTLGAAGSSLARAERVENFYGFPGGISGRKLLARGEEAARELGVEIAQAEVLAISFAADFKSFTVTTTAGELAADAIIIAAGASRRSLAIPGVLELTGHGVSYCATCDAFFYRGKNVGVVGAGEFAAHELAALLPHAGRVTLFTEGAEPSFVVPAGVRVIKEKISTLVGDSRLTGVRVLGGEEVALAGLFLALGTAGSTELARRLGVVLGGSSIRVDERMATNVPGVFAAGDCTGGLLQIVKAAHEGAVAGLSAVQFLRKKSD